MLSVQPTDDSAADLAGNRRDLVAGRLHGIKDAPGGALQHGSVLGDERCWTGNPDSACPIPSLEVPVRQQHTPAPQAPAPQPPYRALLAGLRETIVPDRDGRHGPLPPLLLSMTLVTGLVDAFSYLGLGHVFVANMTGNVVFLGFALAGVAGFSVTSSLAAVVAFAVGALLGGKLGAWHRDHRGRLHSSAATLQALFLAASVILAAAGGSAMTAAGGSGMTAGYRYALIAVLGIAMGIQNAAARTIAVPDLTTTVLTLTITGIAADSTLAGGSGSRAGRRLASVATMLAGAFLGAALIRHTQDYYPLIIALAVIIPGAATSYLLGRPAPGWVRPASPPTPASSPASPASDQAPPPTAG